MSQNAQNTQIGAQTTRGGEGFGVHRIGFLVRLTVVPLEPGLASQADNGRSMNTLNAVAARAFALAGALMASIGNARAADGAKYPNLERSVGRD
jgi:hypothetical protein